MASVLTRSMTGETNSQQEIGSLTEPQGTALNTALKYILNLDSTTVVRGNVKLHLAVEDIVKHAMNHGLNQEQLTSLVQIIVNAKSKLTQAIRTKLAKCLIPTINVPQSLVVRVLSWISTRIFSNPGPTPLHSVLLRWILLVFDFIDGYDQLHKFYDIIFCFINSYLLLPHACHLLFLLTRKPDVKLYKVQQLLQLTKKVGPEPCIIGLLTIYKVYCPELVPMRLEPTHKVFFKAHDAAWRSTITEVISANQVVEDNGLGAERAEIKCRREKALKPKAKRMKLMVPDTHSAAEEIMEEVDLNTTAMFPGRQSVSYAQIDSFKAFTEALDKIEYPSQIAAVLKDKRLQLLMSCYPDQIVLTRLCFWIQHVFAFSFKSNDKESYDRNKQLLEMLLNFSKNVQVQSLSIVEGFLESYLHYWDGQTFAPLIFSLIPCIKPSSFKDLHYTILDPIHQLFFSNDVYFKTMCITSYTKLLHNLALSNRHRTSQQMGTSQVSDATDSQDSQVSMTLSNLTDASHSVVLQLICYLDATIVVGMMNEDDHYLLQVAALDFLNLVSEMYQKFHVPVVCLPVRIIHRLLLSDCVATLARLCDIINVFREAFITVRSMKKPAVACDTILAGQALARKEDVFKCKGVEKFNSLLLDALGMFWQGRLFQARGNKIESIFSFEMPPHLIGLFKENDLTIYKGPAFLGLAYKFLKETQREDKKIHPLQIEPFKDKYLQFLERENFPQFKRLVSANIKSRGASHTSLC